jgi:hypothetical protein
MEFFSKLRTTSGLCGVAKTTANTFYFMALEDITSPHRPRHRCLPLHRRPAGGEILGVDGSGEILGVGGSGDFTGGGGEAIGVGGDRDFT